MKEILISVLGLFDILFVPEKWNYRKGQMWFCIQVIPIGYVMIVIAIIF